MIAGNPTVLLLGATGRTGGRVLDQLLARGVHVKAIVRSAEKLPAALAADPGLTVIEAEVSTLTDAKLREHLLGSDVVISCLGHNITPRGILGPPRDLVSWAVTRVCKAAEAIAPERPVRLILMTSVSVERPRGLDTRRGALERSAVAALRALVPPAKDNQSAADVLAGTVGADNPAVEWVVVRPDTLLEGEVTEYVLHEGLVSSLARPDKTNMANVAHFMCELATNTATFERWKGCWPVIVNTETAAA